MYIFQTVNVCLDICELALERRNHSGVTGKVLQSWHHFKWLYLSWVLFYSDLFDWSFPAMTKAKKETMTIKSRILLSPNCCLWITGWQIEPLGLTIFTTGKCFLLRLLRAGTVVALGNRRNDPPHWGTLQEELAELVQQLLKEH